MQVMNLSDEQLSVLKRTIFLEVRSQLVGALVEAGVITVSYNDQAGFWRGEEWVSIYDLLDGAND